MSGRSAHWRLWSTGSRVGVTRRAGGGPLALATTIILVCALTGPVVAVPSASATPAPTAASIALQPADVPGLSPIPSDLANWTDPDDQGPDEAFILCTATDKLLHQFDTGPDVTISSVYGRGQGPFGSPTESIASAVFSDGSHEDAVFASLVLASTSFQKCWANTTDTLNVRQGITTPNTPSTVVPLPTPGWGEHSSGFTILYDYNVFGEAIVGHLGVTIVQYGAFVVMLLDDDFNGQFPNGLRLSVLKRVALRMGASPRAGAGGTSKKARPESDEAECKSVASTDAADHYLSKLKPYKYLDTKLKSVVPKKFPISGLSFDLPGPFVGKIEYDISIVSPSACYNELTAVATRVGRQILVTAQSPAGGPFAYNVDKLSWVRGNLAPVPHPHLKTEWDGPSADYSLLPQFTKDFDEETNTWANGIVLAEVDVSAVQVETTLFVQGQAALAVDLGPELDIDFSLNKKDLEKLLVEIAIMIGVSPSGDQTMAEAEEETFEDAEEIAADDMASAEGGATIVAGEQVGADFQEPAAEVTEEELPEFQAAFAGDDAAYGQFLAGWQATVAEGAAALGAGADGTVVSGADAAAVDAGTGDAIGGADGFLGWVISLCDELCPVAAVAAL
jgi:hypothetical protein